MTPFPILRASREMRSFLFPPLLVAMDAAEFKEALALSEAMESLTSSSLMLLLVLSLLLMLVLLFVLVFVLVLVLLLLMLLLLMLLLSSVLLTMAADKGWRCSRSDFLLLSRLDLLPSLFFFGSPRRFRMLFFFSPVLVLEAFGSFASFSSSDDMVGWSGVDSSRVDWCQLMYY